jgi:hypothetical protein
MNRCLFLKLHLRVSTLILFAAGDVRPAGSTSIKNPAPHTTAAATSLAALSQTEVADGLNKRQ